jgi:zinc/manganese transport system substrate-binding protein
MARRLFAVLLVSLSAAACTTSGGSASSGGLTAVATIDAWGSILTQLAGDKMDAVSLITNPNTDPHDYEPTPGDARTLVTARVVVENGIGYDAWAARTLAAGGDSHRVVVDVGHVVGVPAGGNPHRWYSPADVERVADAITAALDRADPQDRAYFADRRQQFDEKGLARYHALISEIRARYSGVPIGASESIVAPMADALGLDLVTPPDFLKAISEGIDPSADDKVTIDQQIRDHLIKVYVYNRQNSTPDVTAQVKAARAAGIPVVAVTETLSPSGATFQDWQVTQLEALRTALQKATTG